MSRKTLESKPTVGYDWCMQMKDVVQLGEFCQRLDVADREVRYVLERGFVPAGVAKSPSTGNHRQFSTGQAFWLAIVVKLRQSGVKTSQAAAIADLGISYLRGVTRGLSWDWRFQPERGQFDTEHKYYLDVADQKYGRIRTNACPSERGLTALPWSPIGKKDRKTSAAFQPIVVLQIDLSEIARALRVNPSPDGG
jgi:hypothetical protein